MGGEKMPKRYKITPEEIAEIEKIRKRNKDKTVDKWLEVLLLHAEGKKRSEIAVRTGFNKEYITELVSEYHQRGLEEFAQKQYKGNHRNMTFEEEEEFINEFKKQSEQGQNVKTAEIKSAYEEKVGHPIGGSQIYRVLRRHNWRKATSASDKGSKKPKQP